MYVHYMFITNACKGSQRPGNICCYTYRTIKSSLFNIDQNISFNIDLICHFWPPFNKMNFQQK